MSQLQNTCFYYQNFLIFCITFTLERDKQSFRLHGCIFIRCSFRESGRLGERRTSKSQTESKGWEIHNEHPPGKLAISGNVWWIVSSLIYVYFGGKIYPFLQDRYTDPKLAGSLPGLADRVAVPRKRCAYLLRSCKEQHRNQVQAQFPDPGIRQQAPGCYVLPPPRFLYRFHTQQHKSQVRPGFRTHTEKPDRTLFANTHTAMNISTPISAQTTAGGRPRPLQFMRRCSECKRQHRNWTAFEYATQR